MRSRPAPPPKPCSPRQSASNPSKPFFSRRQWLPGRSQGDRAKAISSPLVATVFAHLKSPREPLSEPAGYGMHTFTAGPRAPRMPLFSNIRRLHAPLLHEVGKSLPPAQTRGCRAKPDGWGVESRNASSKGLLRWSRNPAGLEPAGHTPSGPPGHLSQQAGEGVRAPRSAMCACRRRAAGIMNQNSIDSGISSSI